MSLSVLAGVFSGANQAGTARFYGVGNSERYRRGRKADLSAAGLVSAISSVTAYSSSTANTTLLLFGLPGLPAWASLPDFNGKYLQITNAKSGSELDVNLSAHGFDNATTSLLLVATSRKSETRISFRDIFLAKWKTIIDGKLSGGAKRDGDPTLTWEMFPQGVSYLDANRIYLKVHQKLDIEIDWWPDYDASITYHIFLYLDGAKHLKGYVARWAYWIEGGAKADDIEDKLKPAVISGMNTLNTELGKQLSALSAFAFSDLYYLPGKQLSAAGTGVLTGWTMDDVTIVLES
jgi:hypothetical protein